MTKDEWQTYHQFDDNDMELIEACLNFGGKITMIFDKPLGYGIIKFNC